MRKTASRIDRYFEITSRQSTVKTEILAGVSTFLTLAYITIVNPAVLSSAGFDRSAVFFATVIVSAAATLAMGIFARLPFALAPGLEMDAYVAFFVVGILGYSVPQALGIVFWSTCIFFLLTFLKVKERIINSIPDGMKHSLSAAIGTFVLLIGLKIAGIVTFTGTSPSGIGSLTGPDATALYISLGVILACYALQFRGGVLVSIIAASLYFSVVGIKQDIEPIRFSHEMFSLFWQLDFSVIYDHRAWAPILVLFLVDFYGSVAKIIGITANTNLFNDETGQPIDTDRGLFIDGLSATASPLVGTSSVTTFVESAVGIQVGGRTGITAITCGILMASTFLLSPLLNFVPLAATSGGLVAVGYWLLPKKSVRSHFTKADWTAMVGMGVLTIVSFSLETAMLFGFFVYIVRSIVRKSWPDIYLVGSFILLLVGIGLRLFAQTP